MAKKILVAYASRCGSTGEVAETVGKELCAVGAAVDVKRVQDIRSIGGYDAVVLGAPARMGKLIPEAVKFARRNRDALQKIPTAYFAVGATLKEDTAENREAMYAYLKPLREIKTPAAEEVFGGAVIHSTLSPLLRFVAERDTSGALAEGDFRNWDAIRAWAGSLASVL